MKLAKAYQPNDYEDEIYALWEKSKAFFPKARGNNEYFSLVMPPPNANADLHIGFGLTGALEDIAVRYHRMKGEKTLFLPGADHAGFETQSVYEKHLSKEGKSRFDFTREELYGRIYEFVDNNKNNFQKQMRAMGISCDWSRFTYTLDQKVIDTAYKTFKKMWDENLIYRGERLVNYCTFHGTSFADIEVHYEDTISPLYYIKYGPFALATTRPETKFGDTAVAVHPDDKRYKKWINKVITVEGVNGPFEIRVIADEMVDPEFGTGVVKITPAHDFNDWEAGQRHNLEVKQVIDHSGRLNHHAGRFAGMTVPEARKAVANALENKGLLVRVDNNYKNRVGKCYKCGTIIEPMVMEQWFVDMKPLAAEAIKTLKQKKIKFYPDSKRTQLISYLEKLKDWNISRQIAWGIPIPAFRNVDDPSEWIFDERVDQETIKVGKKTYHRDPDVFDTWFSSSSWPYATLNYPDGQDFKEFYPLSLMETGGEILYPWVSRMIMLGLYVTGEVPFEEVYIHGYVMAEDGSKMSKSKGNVVDPVPVIKKYGSDALRMGIISGRAPAVNRGYDPRRVEEARNFCNKLWNVARFVEGAGTLENTEPAEPKTIADHWMAGQLSSGTETITGHLENYRFAEAYDSLYHLVWDDVADWYIEASKKNPQIDMLAYVLKTVLKLSHPFAPFVSETIWQTLYPETGTSLATSKWPTAGKFDTKAAKEFETIKSIVSEVRQIKTLLQIKGGELVYSESQIIEKNSDLISDLAKLQTLREIKDAKGLRLTQTGEKAWLDVDTQTTKQYKKRLDERQTDLKTQLKNIEARLSNKKYLEKAPAALVSESKSLQKDIKTELETISKQLAQFS